MPQTLLCPWTKALGDPNMFGYGPTHICFYWPSLPSIPDNKEDWKLSVKKRYIFVKLGSIAISNGLEGKLNKRAGQYMYIRRIL